MTSACFLFPDTTCHSSWEREREKKKNPPPPESCRSKVSSLSQSPQVLAEPCQTCCCCPKWDAVLGAVGRALILSSLVNSRFDAHLLDVWRSVFLMMLLLFCHGSHYGKRLTETRLFYSRALACLCRSTRGLPLNYSLCSLFFFTNVASAFQEKVGSKSVDLTTLLEHHAFSPPLMQKTSAAGWLKEKKEKLRRVPRLAVNIFNLEPHFEARWHPRTGAC